MGKCFCVEGRDGADCSIKLQDACPLACSQRGVCRFGQCFCKPGYVGRGCEIQVKCSAKCLINGVCAYGHCFCVPGWEGKDCDIAVSRDRQIEALEADLTRAYEVSKEGARKANVPLANTHFCDGACSMRGICANNTCWCDAGFYGPNCQYVQAGAVAQRCPNNCNGNGNCLFSQCFCNPGWSGPTCEVESPVQCPGNCNDKGICHYGFCHCQPGYKGADCSAQETCDKECVNGLCIGGVCECIQGYKGRNCQEKTDQFAVAKFREVPPSSTIVSTRSVASDTTTTITPTVASVLALGESNCPLACGSNGVCFKEQCFCAQGYAGADCSLRTHAVDDVTAAVLSVHSRVSSGGVGGASASAATAASSTVPPLASLSVSASPPGSHRFSYALLGVLCFAAGVVTCLGAQFAWDRYQKHKRQRATQAILTPLLHTLDQ